MLTSLMRGIQTRNQSKTIIQAEPEPQNEHRTAFIRSIEKTLSLSNLDSQVRQIESIIPILSIQFPDLRNTTLTGIFDNPENFFGMVHNIENTYRDDLANANSKTDST